MFLFAKIWFFSLVFGLLSLLVIKQVGYALGAHPILLITCKNNRTNWNAITTTFKDLVLFYQRNRMGTYQILSIFYIMLNFLYHAQPPLNKPFLRDSSCGRLYKTEIQLKDILNYGKP